MCQFHQIQIITRYLTKTLKLEVSKDLRHIVLQMTKLTKSEFISAMDKWDKELDLFLKERTIAPITGKSWFTHKKLGSARFS